MLWGLVVAVIIQQIAEVVHQQVLVEVEPISHREVVALHNRPHQRLRHSNIISSSSSIISAGVVAEEEEEEKEEVELLDPIFNISSINSRHYRYLFIKSIIEVVLRAV